MCHVTNIFIFIVLVIDVYIYSPPILRHTTRITFAIKNERDAS